MCILSVLHTSRKKLSALSGFPAFSLLVQHPTLSHTFPYLSEGIFRMEDAVPMEAQPISPDGLTLEGGFEWHHGGYEKKNAGMQAVRAFTPPCTIRSVCAMHHTPYTMHHAPCIRRAIQPPGCIVG